MKYKFFHIPVADATHAETELNAFISQHRIAHADKQFLLSGSGFATPILTFKPNQ